MLDKFLKIKKSKLPKAGRGVFTTVDIAKGDVITDIRGPITNHQGYENMTDLQCKYSFYINKNNVIDSYSELDQFGRYINDANGTRDNKFENNSEFVVKRRSNKYVVLIVAIRNIRKGEEILVDYGSDYWVN